MPDTQSDLVFLSADKTCSYCQKARILLKAAEIRFCEIPVLGIPDPLVTFHGRRYEGLQSITRALMLGLIGLDQNSDEMPYKVVGNLLEELYDTKNDATTSNSYPRQS